VRHSLRTLNGMQGNHNPQILVSKFTTHKKRRQKRPVSTSNGSPSLHSLLILYNLISSKHTFFDFNFWK